MSRPSSKSVQDTLCPLPAIILAFKIDCAKALRKPYSVRQAELVSSSPESGAREVAGIWECERVGRQEETFNTVCSCDC